MRKFMPLEPHAAGKKMPFRRMIPKKALMAFVLIFIWTSMPVPRSYALVVNDPIHTAVSELQNAILRTEWAKQIALGIEKLHELKTQTLELLRFHSGFDEILGLMIGDPLRNLIGVAHTNLRDAFIDFGFITPQLEILEGHGGPADIRAALERMSGEIPETDARPYLLFDEMQVVDAFDLARQIREAGSETRSAAARIAGEAETASPKGAVRLQVQALSQLMVLSQQNQETMAKLLELGATRIEQVSRAEKQAEIERVKFMEDASEYASGILRIFRGA